MVQYVAFTLFLNKVSSVILQIGFSEHDALRADYYHWCIPLFDDPATLKKSWNFTCTFLQRFEATYFISEPNEIIDVPCCIFEPHLPPVRPDWLKECNYTGTEMADGVLCHKWWFYESQDLYYGFWYAVGPKPTPVRFLGLSTLGETTLEYSNYQNNTLSGDGDKIFKIPDNCNTICDPKMNKSRGKHSQHLAGVFGTLLIP